MKRQVILFGLIYILFSIVMASGACPGNLVSYWKFENNVQDFLNANNGVNHGTSYVSGKIGNSCSFDGASYVSVANSESLRITTGSIAFWIKPSSADLDSGNPAIILDKTYPSGGSSYDGYYAAFDNNVPGNTGKLKFGSIFEQLVSSSVFSANNWYYVVLTASPAGRYIYINGNLDASTTQYTTLPAGYNQLVFGKSSALGGQSYYAGILDEVAIYNTALTSQEILENYKSGAGKDYCEDLCDDSQTIMRLSENYNSHAETWNLNNYNVRICYDFIFGHEYTGSNPHSCSSSNNIVWLNKTTNSHIKETSNTAQPPTSSYKIPVCYGDLICHSRTSCLADEEMIIALNNTINSHASTIPDLSYKNKICCSSGATIPTQVINSVYWTNTNNQVITQAKKNENIRLAAETSNLNDQQITFRIYKEMELLTSLSGNVYLGKATTPYVVSSSLNNGEQIWFNASVTSNSGISKASGLLTICNCNDGTACNSCSATKPKYCDASGNLIDNQCGAPHNCGCDSGYTCNDATGVCETGTTNPTNCMDYDGLTGSDYDDQTACIADVFHVAIPSVEAVEGSGFCSDLGINCFCRWVSENQNSRCIGSWSSADGSCNWISSTLKDCDEEPDIGFRVINLTKDWTGINESPLCNETEAIILKRACLSSALLNFFGSFGFILAIIILVIFYFARIKFINMN